MNESFTEVLNTFRSGERKANQWNWCISYDKSQDGPYGAFIMGEGSEQVLASSYGFHSEEEVRNLYYSLGVKRIMWI